MSAVEARLDTISRVEATNGERSPALIGELTSLAALNEYDATRNLLVERNVARETIDEMLSPEMPPVIRRCPRALPARLAIGRAATSTRAWKSRASDS